MDPSIQLDWYHEFLAAVKRNGGDLLEPIPLDVSTTADEPADVEVAASDSHDPVPGLTLLSSIATQEDTDALRSKVKRHVFENNETPPPRASNPLSKPTIPSPLSQTTTVSSQPEMSTVGPEVSTSSDIVPGT